MIIIEHISKRFNKLQVLNNINLSCNKGECIALIGPNGCGKTTLIKCILGMVIPNEGSIKVNGETISNSFLYRKNIGYMPQIGRYPENMTIGQIFEMIKEIRQSTEPLDENLLVQFQLHQLFDKRMSTLSGGTTQKVNAALAFMFNPDILILDEPTAGLDPLSAELLKVKIKNEKDKGKLIIISSHILADLEEITTHVVYLIDGELEFFKSMESLIKETGTQNLSKAIAKIMTEIKVVHENN